jgi:glucokinase
LSFQIPNSALTVGIDIGGTKVLGGVVDFQGNISTSTRKDTPKSGGEDLYQEICTLIRELQKDSTISGIGISCAALISSDRRTILSSPNISNWNSIKLGDRLEQEFSLPVFVENDANAAMWAEFKFGNARNFNPVMFFIIGTGMGGGFVVDGKLYRGAFGIGAEFGHMIVERNGIICGCGVAGCIEQYASGTALMRYTREAIEKNPSAGVELLNFGDGTIAGLTGAALTTAAKAGNKLAISAFEICADWLANAIASYTLILDPQAIIIGGGVADAGELFLTPVRASIPKYMPFVDSHPAPEIIAAKFGNNAGLIGAALLARG